MGISLALAALFLRPQAESQRGAREQVRDLLFRCQTAGGAPSHAIKRVIVSERWSYHANRDRRSILDSLPIWS